MTLLDADALAARVTGGGYEYRQLGEGNCFLRALPGCALRPIATGWFAEFDALAEPSSARVAYGSLATRFAGATYDPTSHYRAAEVFDFFAEQGLTVSLLRALSQRQLGLMRAELDALGLPRAELSRRRPARSARRFPRARCSTRARHTTCARKPWCAVRWPGRGPALRPRTVIE